MARGDYPTKARRNGWTLPLHPLQVVAWAFTAIYAAIHLGVVAPAFVSGWQPFVYVVSFFN